MKLTTEQIARIVGTYSIPSEDAELGAWPTETVSITEWEINEII